MYGIASGPIMRRTAVTAGTPLHMYPCSQHEAAPPSPTSARWYRPKNPLRREMDAHPDHIATIRVRVRCLAERSSYPQLESEPGTQFEQGAEAHGAPGRLPRAGPRLLQPLEVPRGHSVNFQNALRIS